VGSEGDESPVAKDRRMMIRMFIGLKRSLRRTYKNNSMNLKRFKKKKNSRRHRNN
jgi:hypothetical protein